MKSHLGQDVPRPACQDRDLDVAGGNRSGRRSLRRSHKFSSLIRQASRTRADSLSGIAATLIGTTLSAGTDRKSVV